MKDYSGKIMEIDLSHGSIRIKDIEAQLVRQYIGGIGFNARILYDEIPIGADPFRRRTVLVFAACTRMVGTPFPTASRSEASANLINRRVWHLQFGGFFWPALKPPGMMSW